MNTTTSNFGSLTNRFVSTMWFVLSVAILSAGYFSLHSPAPFMIIPLTLLSVIIFSVGCQRTTILKMKENKFSTLVRNLSFAMCASSVWAVFMAGAIG